MKNDSRIQKIIEEAVKKIREADDFALQGNQVEINIKILPKGTTFFIDLRLSEKHVLEKS